MKQEEKNQVSREKILAAAIKEFGEKGYDGASLNALLLESGLSKGLVYHYFKNRDNLYLACVEESFSQLTQALTDAAPTDFQAYFDVRGRFFIGHPLLAHLFFDSLLHPPLQLRGELEKARAGLDRLNLALLHNVLGDISLRDGLTETDALDAFTLVQNALHLQFFSDANTADASLQYEQQARKTLQILLYGLAGRAE